MRLAAVIIIAGWAGLAGAQETNTNAVAVVATNAPGVSTNAPATSTNEAVATNTAASAPAPARETAAAPADPNAAPVMDWNYFEPITHKNIFDPTRAGGRYVRQGSRPRAVERKYFTFHGAIGDGGDDDVAFFVGEGAPPRGYSKVGDLINGFKIMKITLDTVQLAEPDGKLVTLAMDEAMRREDEGPWTKADEAAPIIIVPTPVPGGDTPAAAGVTGDAAAPASAGLAGESDVLKRLRLKREQEEK